jgi:DNA (cytosine-5)-methyltransferase 1
MNKVSDLEALHGYDLAEYRIPNKRQVLRNCVAPETGLQILQAAELALTEPEKLF